MGLPQPIEDAKYEATPHPHLLRLRDRIFSCLMGKHSGIRKWVAVVGKLPWDVQEQASVSIWLTTSLFPARAVLLWRHFARSCSCSSQERYQACPLRPRHGTLEVVPTRRSTAKFHTGSLLVLFKKNFGVVSVLRPGRGRRYQAPQPTGEAASPIGAPPP